MNNIVMVQCPYCNTAIPIQSSVPIIQVPMKIDGQDFTGEIPYMECPHCHRTITFEYN